MANNSDDKPKMVKLQFKATSEMLEYHDRPTSWKDGTKREVPEDQADALLRDFPDNFKKAR